MPALVLTAVFDQNLADVAETIALGHFRLRRARTRAAAELHRLRKHDGQLDAVGPARPRAARRRRNWRGASSTPGFPIA